MGGPPVILLFTDLADSSELLEHAADERVQHVLRAHHRLVKDALAAHSGSPPKWLGDGLMAVFPSPADAVRCAVTMQQTARRRPAPERLTLRVGLHAGPAPVEESDWFATPVVEARWLCKRAASGQILCSGLVVELLKDRRAFRFAELDVSAALESPAYVVEYDRDDPAALLRQTPFTGRAQELARLERRLEDARGGRGSVVLVAGEPGIGKTRLLEEFAETARADRTLVLWGRCYEGGAAGPYGPFVEAIAGHAWASSPESLQTALGVGAAPLAQLVPALRERLPGIPEPLPLQPDEERIRLLDAVTQLLLALAARGPTVLVLDDLHWADPGTVTLLRHVGRFAAHERLLVLGAYRDVEVDAQHPLAEVLGTLPRETSYEQLHLRGLDVPAVRELVDNVADRVTPAGWVEALARDTSGNPFFLREVLLSLDEEGTWDRDVSAPAGLAALRLPDSVRQVIGRRLARLSDGTRQLLGVAAAFTGGIDFEVTRRVAGLEERAALDALDAALAAQLLVPTGAATAAYDFTHALVRHTLYDGLSAPRQARLQREIAEVLVSVYGDRALDRAPEIAEHYHRSAGLPGAEHGLPYALAAAEQSEHAAAYGEAARFWRMAVGLLPAGDARIPEFQMRLALALTWSLNADAALDVALTATEALAATRGPERTADHLAELAHAMATAGFPRGAWACARAGLPYAKGRRDLTWVRLTVHDIARRESEDDDSLGIPIDSPERSEVEAIARTLTLSASERIILAANGCLCPRNRDEAVGYFRCDPWWFANYGRAHDLARWHDLVAESQKQGRIAELVMSLAYLARGETDVGRFAAARAAYEEAAERARSLPGSSLQRLILAAAAYEFCLATGAGFEQLVHEQLTLQQEPMPEDTWSRAAIQASAARVFGWLGSAEQSLAMIGALRKPLKVAPGWVPNYPMVACDAAEALWLIEHAEHAEVLERCIQEKVVVPDLAYLMRDGRRSLGHLCALRGDYEAARTWFASARAALEERGARPLRAIVDYDEALMYARRDAAGDPERALPLLDLALKQFRALAMPGWIERAAGLGDRLAELAAPSRESLGHPVSEEPVASEMAELLHAGSYWTVSHAGVTGHLKDMKGLHYLAALLRNPDREFHALDLVQGSGGERATAQARPQAGLPILDAPAKAAYRQRLEGLRAELEEAEAFNDAGRAARARDEMEALGEQLAAAVGLGGRDRAAGAASERARLAVTKRIKVALERIRQTSPALADHLASRVRTGTYCSYAPDPLRPIAWVVHRPA